MRHYFHYLILLTGMLQTAYAAVPPQRQLFFQSDNMVWWGTEFGLNRFQTENELWGNIRPEPVSDLCLDEKTMWVGTEHGVFYADLRYLDWKGYTAKQGLPSDTVVRIVADLDYVYAAGPHGLARFNKLVEQWEPMGDFAAKRIYDLYSNQAQLWVATDAGVFYFDKKFEKWESYTESTGLISNDVFRVFYFSDYIWALTDRGFSRYSTSMKSWNSYKLGDNTVGSSVDYLLVDASYIWVVSPGGVRRFSGKNQTWENFSKNMPIEKKSVTSISTSGSVKWFTTSDGVFSFDEDQRRWKTYTAVDGLSDDVQDQVYTSGQTTLCKKGTSFSYLKTTDDLWYASTITVTGGGMKQRWKSHMDETGLGVTAPSGQNVNLLGRAYYKLENKAVFPEPVFPSIGNYITNKNLDSQSITTTIDTTGATRLDTTVIARYKDFLYGWAKAQLNLNADLNNGRTFRGTYDNTDPLGDRRYSAEYRGFGDDNLRRLGWRTDQKTDYFYSSLVNPTYLEGAGLRTEFGDRVGDKKLRRVNTGLWAGWGKTLYMRKLVQFREDNFYELKVQNIITESVEIIVDGKVIDPADYSIERTMGLLTFKNEGLANPDSRIEISCQYQPVIGEFTNEMASAENVVAVNDKVSLGVNGVYRGVKEPNQAGTGLDTNRAFAGSVNGKIEAKSADGRLYLRAVPEVSGSYNDSILVKKQGSAAKLDVYSVARNLKFKGLGLFQSPDYVTLADQNSVYGRINHQAEAEFVYDLWQQYMPFTVGASTVDAWSGGESRQYAQYLISPPSLPSVRLFGMHQSMKNYTHVSRDSLSDSLKSDRLNGVVEVEWGKSFVHLDRLWFNASYSINLFSDTLFDTIPGSKSLAARFDQRLDENFFQWVRFSPVKKLQLELKSVERVFDGRGNTSGPFAYKGLRVRPEFKLFSQELIPGVTAYGDYLLEVSDDIVSPDSAATMLGQSLNTSLLLIPGVWWGLLNPFQLNVGYGYSSGDSIVESGTSTPFVNSNRVSDMFTRTFSVKPMLDFSEDLHFASRTEISSSSNFGLGMQNGVKVYNEARLAFWERKTRLDFDFNIFDVSLFSPDLTTRLDTVKAEGTTYEFNFKWTERWIPNFRTELPIVMSWANVDSSIATSTRTADTSTGYLNSIAPGILFDWRIQGKTIRECRTQFYVGAALANGKNFNLSTYDKAEQTKVDVQVKAGANFFLRLLLAVDYMFDQHVMKYDLAELKITALF
jgi:hypothetical protein